MSTTAFPVTIYHNPVCGTSRNALAMIQGAGYSPQVVLYLDVGFSRDELESLLKRMNAVPSDILRSKGTPAEDLGLLDPDIDEVAILDAMLMHPVLVNRPIVATPLGVVLARPSETVQSILDRPLGAFTKEDGQVVPPAD